ncbi:hypothetical protein BFV94_4510 [Alteromonas macleodii]|uniref:Uncharacterized protein n=2 Tax=Alteromonas macleodii TaxID=28108 RepID=A0AB36FRZ2_ALTMA|nr:hypothetical protein BFV93_4727 [Alteromonas macleodii]OES24761.1 hypothetical protein BFV95_4520 [Alteromonas macleodii]OES25039.1 hypothetical protein BFV94_4510 [Alteromonas macleodii]OES39082.1 hypothetical protein BFV96_4230 [Alteromonas macleodii]
MQIRDVRHLSLAEINLRTKYIRGPENTVINRIMEGDQIDISVWLVEDIIVHSNDWSATHAIVAEYDD